MTASPPIPDPDDTERFALQTCPHCTALVSVLLCFATASCPGCSGIFEVAPLEEASPSSTLRTGALDPRTLGAL